MVQGQKSPSRGEVPAREDYSNSGRSTRRKRSIFSQPKLRLRFSKPKDSVTEPSSQPLPKDYEVPGLGKEKKESLSAKTDDKPETKVTESADLPKREEMDRPRTKQRDESLVEYDDGPKPKKEKRHSKKYKKRRTAHSSVNAKISSLEKRVGRLEKKLGMKNGSPKKKSKISLRKRVEILEQEVSGLKNKSKAE